MFVTESLAFLPLHYQTQLSINTVGIVLQYCTRRVLTIKLNLLKVTVPQDFRLQVFFMSQFPPSH
jgi:hypothetical protein